LIKEETVISLLLSTFICQVVSNLHQQTAQQHLFTIGQPDKRPFFKALSRFKHHSSQRTALLAEIRTQYMGIFGSCRRSTGPDASMPALSWSLWVVQHKATR
jgi:hypothetical protein